MKNYYKDGLDFLPSKEDFSKYDFNTLLHTIYNFKKDYLNTQNKKYPCTKLRDIASCWFDLLEFQKKYLMEMTKNTTEQIKEGLGILQCRENEMSEEDQKALQKIIEGNNDKILKMSQMMSEQIQRKFECMKEGQPYINDNDSDEKIIKDLNTYLDILFDDNKSNNIVDSDEQIKDKALCDELVETGGFKMFDTGNLKPKIYIDNQMEEEKKQEGLKKYNKELMDLELSTSDKVNTFKTFPGNANSEFRKITDQLSDTYERKNADYGNSFEDCCHEVGWAYAYGHMYEKLKRVKTLFDNEKNHKVQNESIEDSLLDLANYAILTLLEVKKGTL